MPEIDGGAFGAPLDNPGQKVDLGGGPVIRRTLG
jgi:hypothetical protein